MQARDDRQHPEQRSYLLRLWRASGRGPLRATLIAIVPQALPRHFADLAMLADFLLSEPLTVQLSHDAHNYCTPDKEE